MAQHWVDVDLTVSTSQIPAGDVAFQATIQSDHFGQPLCTVTDIVLCSHDTEAPSFDVYFTEESWEFASNDDFALTDAQREKALVPVAVNQAYSDDNGKVYHAGSLAIPLGQRLNKTVYVTGVIRGAAVTYAAANDLHMRLGLLVI